MERLTYSVNTGIQDVVLTDGKSVEECLEWKNVLERLAGYEDLEGQGKLLKLPCAVGDTYFCIDDGSYPNEWEFVNVQQIISVMDKIGITVFLTREDADAALKLLMTEKKFH